MLFFPPGNFKTCGSNLKKRFLGNSVNFDLEILSLSTKDCSETSPFGLRILYLILFCLIDVVTQVKSQRVIDFKSMVILTFIGKKD
jgi:hypothetical protein